MKIVVYLLAPFVFATSAFAQWTLTNIEGETVVSDLRSGNVWFPDLGALSGMSYSEQSDAIAALNAEEYFSISEWKLATVVEMADLWTWQTEEIRTLFSPSQVRNEGDYNWHYWTGRYDHVDPWFHGNLSVSETAWGNFVWGDFDYEWGSYAQAVDEYRYDRIGAWVVAPMSSVVVPEPSTWALLAGVGSLIFVSIHRSRAKRSRS